MTFKFKVQTALMVGGLVAASYANTCFYAQTTGLCFYSGNVVDEIVWADGSNSKVSATADWYANANSYTSGSGAGGYTSYVPATATPTWCSGPAKFQDPSGHTDSIPEWESNSADCNGFAVPLFTLSATSAVNWGTTGGQACQ